VGWIKLSDCFADNAKIMDADEAGLLWLHLKAMCYCAASQTDGLIHRRIARMDTEKQLIAIGLWDEIEGQVWINDWLKFNISKAENIERKKRDEARKAKWKEKHAKGGTHPGTHPERIAGRRLSDQTRPDPLEGSVCGARPDGAALTGGQYAKLNELNDRSHIERGESVTTPIELPRKGEA
jgi:hypothetical protein